MIESVLNIARSLGPVVAVPFATLAVGTLTCAAYLGTTRLLRYRNGLRVSEVARELSPRIVGGSDLTLAAMEAVDAYGRNAVVQFLRRARRQVDGEAGLQIAQALQDLGETDHLIATSRSRLRARRLSGLWGLAECRCERSDARLLDALDHPDAATRGFARQCLLVSRPEKMAEKAFLSWLAEPEEVLERSVRFPRWIVTRYPDLVDRVFEQRDLSDVHIEILERAAADTGMAEVVIEGDSEAAMAAHTPADVTVRERVSRIPQVLDPIWMDDRVERLAAVGSGGFGLRAEVAFGCRSAHGHDHRWRTGLASCSSDRMTRARLADHRPFGVVDVLAAFLGFSRSPVPGCSRSPWPPPPTEPRSLPSVVPMI